MKHKYQITCKICHKLKPVQRQKQDTCDDCLSIQLRNYMADQEKKKEIKELWLEKRELTKRAKEIAVKSNEVEEKRERLLIEYFEVGE